MDGGTLSQTEYLNNWHIWRKCGTFWGLQLVGFGSYPVFPDIQLFQLSSYLVFCVWVEFHIRAWQTDTGRTTVLDGDGLTFAQVKASRLGDDPVGEAAA